MKHLSFWVQKTSYVTGDALTHPYNIVLMKILAFRYGNRFYEKALLLRKRIVPWITMILWILILFVSGRYLMMPFLKTILVMSPPWEEIKLFFVSHDFFAIIFSIFILGCTGIGFRNPELFEQKKP